MKFKHIIASAAVAAGLLTLGSCQSKLDIPQHSVTNIGSFYKTDTDAEEGIVAVYDQFKTCHSGGINSVCWLANFLGDDLWAGGGSRADGSFYQWSEYTFGSDNATIKNLYAGLYTLIYRANLIIERVSPDTEVKKRAVAEAKVFRAWANFQLVTLWGPAPLVDHVLTEKEYMQSNSTVEKLWAAVETDLNDAIGSGDLTSKKQMSDVTFRVTKEFAQAMLGKAYLWQKKYSDAATEFENVIKTELFDLNPDLTNFGTPDAVAGIEDVFVMRAVNDAATTSPNVTYHGMWTGLRGEKYKYTSESPFWSYTFGFQNNPTKALYDTFVKIEGKNGYRLTNFIATYDDMVNKYGTSINDDMDIYDNEGYYNHKYRVIKPAGRPYYYPLTDHIMRYDEVLIFAAEAQFQAGNTGRAKELINKIRTRAKAPEVSDVTLQVIKDESYVELCFEGLRYQNIIRWGEAADRLANRGATHPHLYSDGTVKYVRYNEDGKVGFKKNKHELLPFPAEEMNVNSNMKQNPGW